MKSADIREKFLSFFETKGAKRLPSSSLVPDDPSLLLTSAGMVQFKPVFLGIKDLGFTRATTCQKCVRTTDIDIIGTTGRHHSFFEMLGNFSFGDYFKSEACAWAYEFSVDVLGLDPERIWYSIYEDDDESEAIWADEVGVPRDRIVRMGAKDNFWSAGPTGPCGPCSELYYDQGAAVGCGEDTCAPGCECDRFLEYWNLVFMQYDRQEDGSLIPLPKQNIDTGMGLERVATIMQGVTSNYETDELRALMSVAEEITGAKYGVSDKTDTSLRILADHTRSIPFLIADGVLPSNEGRGYVLRRILRRAVRHGRLLGVEDPFLTQMIAVVTAQMSHQYPELVEHQDLIRRIVLSEEQRFGTTLRQGLIFLGDTLDSLKAAGGSVLDGTLAFTLHDTFGFPVELTAEIAAEADVQVDMDAFEVEMKAQRDRARAAVKDESWTGFGGAFADVAKASGKTEFLGYESDESEATIVSIIVDGVPVDSITSGDEAQVVLDRTPFYGEQGGQVGDCGVLSAEGAVFRVDDATIPVSGLISHKGALESGEMTVGMTVFAAIDVSRRERIRRNHTSTHLLHWALRLVLGDHVKQSGSFVAPDRMRFDFTHFEGVTAEQLDKIERMTNAKIMENHPVRAYETSLTSARETGVTALFGEKYGEFVRVLEVGNFSKELCGGTHVGRTCEIGFVKITSEGSVGSNLRRIEAVTSFDAMNAVYAEEKILADTAEILKVRPSEVADRVTSLIRRLREADMALTEAKRRGSSGDLDSMLEGALDVGYPVVVARVEIIDSDDIRDVADQLRGKLHGGAVVLAATLGQKVLLLAAGTDEAVAKGFNAGAIIKAIAPAVQGGGGGKPNMAQAGGKDPSGIDEALRLARQTLGVE